MLCHIAAKAYPHSLRECRRMASIEQIYTYSPVQGQIDSKAFAPVEAPPGRCGTGQGPCCKAAPDGGFQLPLSVAGVVSQPFFALP